MTSTQETEFNQPEWFHPSQRPEDGDSIWVAVREHDGITVHVDYAVVFVDVDGLIVQRYETREYEHWPPANMVAWRLCEVPEFGG